MSLSLHCTALHCIVLYCIVLYCIASQWEGQGEDLPKDSVPRSILRARIVCSMYVPFRFALRLERCEGSWDRSSFSGLWRLAFLFPFLGFGGEGVGTRGGDSRTGYIFGSGSARKRVFGLHHIFFSLFCVRMKEREGNPMISRQE